MLPLFRGWVGHGSALRDLSNKIEHIKANQEISGKSKRRSLRKALLNFEAEAIKNDNLVEIARDWVRSRGIFTIGPSFDDAGAEIAQERLASLDSVEVVLLDEALELRSRGRVVARGDSALLSDNDDDAMAMKWKHFAPFDLRENGRNAQLQWYETRRQILDLPVMMGKRQGSSEKVYTTPELMAVITTYKSHVLNTVFPLSGDVLTKRGELYKSMSKGTLAKELARIRNGLKAMDKASRSRRSRRVAAAAATTVGPSTHFASLSSMEKDLDEKTIAPVSTASEVPILRRRATALKTLRDSNAASNEEPTLLARAVLDSDVKPRRRTMIMRTIAAHGAEQSYGTRDFARAAIATEAPTSLVEKDAMWKACFAAVAAETEAMERDATEHRARALGEEEGTQRRDIVFREAHEGFLARQALELRHAARVQMIRRQTES